MSIGKIISVSDLMVEAFVAGEPLKRRDMLYAEDGGRKYEFEVQDMKGSVASLIPFGSCKGLHLKVQEGWRSNIPTRSWEECSILMENPSIRLR